MPARVLRPTSFSTSTDELAVLKTINARKGIKTKFFKSNITFYNADLLKTINARKGIKTTSSMALRVELSQVKNHKCPQGY